MSSQKLLSDQELLALLKENFNAGCVYLNKHYRRKVLAQANVWKCPEDGDDVFQTVVLKVYKDIGEQKPIGNFKEYFFAACGNEFKNIIKKKKRRQPNAIADSEEKLPHQQKKSTAIDSEDSDPINKKKRRQLNLEESYIIPTYNSPSDSVHDRDDDDPLRQLVKNERAAAVHQVLEKWGDTLCKRLITSFHFDGLPLTDLAVLWGKSYNYLKGRNSECRNELKDAVEKILGTDIF